MEAQAQNWFMDILRNICVFVDGLIYGLLRWILQSIFDLSNLTAASGLFEGVYTRIYVILGIFMAFKLSFSFFQYIIDPESMVGKSEKGVSKLITNAIIMLVALVALPTLLFGNSSGQGLVYRAQNAFLPMLPRLLLGISENSGVAIGNGNNGEDIEAAANVMAVSSLQAFFMPATDLDEKCGSGTYEKTPAITSIAQFKEYVNLTCSSGVNVAGFGAPLYYRYHYTPFLSGLVGLLMAFILLLIGIDIGIRVFKLLILQIVAPIPIMSLIDPKGRKDGAFSHWIKSLISTFLDIFIKLGILYLVITFIQLIVSNGLFENFPAFTEEPLRAAYLIVVLIVALLLFAREAPSFIKDALGMKKESGGLGVGLGATVGAIGGLTAGGLSGMVSGAVAGATADPKTGSYAAGRDLAGQIRRGDKNWKGGIQNRAAEWSRNVQGNRTANRLGLTEDNVKAADDYAKAMENRSKELDMVYSEAVSSGHVPEEYGSMENLRREVSAARDTAAKARKNADTAKKDRESLVVDTTTPITKRRSDMHSARRNRREAERTAETARRQHDEGVARYGSEEAYKEYTRRTNELDKARTERKHIDESINAKDHGRFDPYNGDYSRDNIEAADRRIEEAQRAADDFERDHPS